MSSNISLEAAAAVAAASDAVAAAKSAEDAAAAAKDAAARLISSVFGAPNFALDADQAEVARERLVCVAFFPLAHADFPRLHGVQVLSPEKVEKVAIIADVWERPDFDWALTETLSGLSPCFLNPSADVKRGLAEYLSAVNAPVVQWSQWTFEWQLPSWPSFRRGPFDKGDALSELADWLSEAHEELEENLVESLPNLDTINDKLEDILLKQIGKHRWCSDSVRPTSSHKLSPAYWGFTKRNRYLEQAKSAFLALPADHPLHVSKWGGCGTAESEPSGASGPALEVHPVQNDQQQPPAAVVIEVKATAHRRRLVKRLQNTQLLLEQWDARAAAKVASANAAASASTAGAAGGSEVVVNEVVARPPVPSSSSSSLPAAARASPSGSNGGGVGRGGRGGRGRGGSVGDRELECKVLEQCLLEKRSALEEERLRASGGEGGRRGGNRGGHRGGQFGGQRVGQRGGWSDGRFKRPAPYPPRRSSNFGNSNCRNNSNNSSNNSNNNSSNTNSSGVDGRSSSSGSLSPSVVPDVGAVLGQLAESVAKACNRMESAASRLPRQSPSPSPSRSSSSRLRPEADVFVPSSRSSGSASGSRRRSRSPDRSPSRRPSRHSPSRPSRRSPSPAPSHHSSARSHRSSSRSTTPSAGMDTGSPVSRSRNVDYRVKDGLVSARREKMSGRE